MRAKNIKSNNYKNTGFTIIELLIVVVIISILATLTLVSYIGINKKAAVASLQADLISSAQQLKLFQVDHSSYPIDIADCPNPANGKMCLKFSPGNTFSYTYNNNTSPQTFSLDVSNIISGVTYRVTNNTAPTLYTAASPPNAPTGVTASAVGQTQVTLIWTAATDSNSLAIVNYKIYRGTSMGNETYLATVGNVLTYVNTGLTPNTTYYYKVTAVNSSLSEGAYSNEVSATPIGPIAVNINGTVFAGNNPYDGLTWWGADYTGDYGDLAWQTNSTFNLGSYTNGTISNVTLLWDHSSYSGGNGGRNRYIVAASPRSILYSSDTTISPSLYTGSNLTTYVNSKKGTNCQINWEADNGSEGEDIWGIEVGLSNPRLSFTWTPN